MTDLQLQVLVRAHLNRYGDAAAANASERARALSELGDAEGAHVWQRIADLIAREANG
jgi:hypothetical protein